ncbi:L,D-transpeptidase family protein [Candidatus Pelagibacter bacterium]|nr:L,D-transpeptidase family protein [Candidatus Pelagibacter bacterium]
MGKNGLSKSKIEGDLKTPIGVFSLENLYYRSDRVDKPITNLKCVKIDKNMGWCDDSLNKEKYNKLIKVNNNIKHEKLYRRDHKYDLLIPIKYNFVKRTPGKGSCIFIHLTKNYAPTAGCVALKKKDLLIILRLIKRNTKIKIY